MRSAKIEASEALARRSSAVMRWEGGVVSDTA